MEYEFLNELTEARLFKDPKKLDGVSIGNIADSFFGAMLALQVLRYENPKEAKKYARRTMSTGLDGWRGSGTDFNNMAQILINQDRYSDRVAVDRPVGVPQMQLMGWLRNITHQRFDTRYDSKFFLAAQRQLGVRSAGLKSARRTVADWPNSTPQERKDAVSRIYGNIRQDLGASDLFASFNKVMNRRNKLGEPSKGIPLWAKVAGAAAGGYYLGRKIGSF